jgi:hypothetical protein
MNQHFDVGQQLPVSDAYRAAERSMLTLQAQQAIEQTEAIVRDLEIQLAKFVAELQASGHEL